MRRHTLLNLVGNTILLALLILGTGCGDSKVVDTGGQDGDGDDAGHTTTDDGGTNSSGLKLREGIDEFFVPASMSELVSETATSTAEAPQMLFSGDAADIVEDAEAGDVLGVAPDDIYRVHDVEITNEGVVIDLGQVYILDLIEGEWDHTFEFDYSDIDVQQINQQLRTRTQGLNAGAISVSSTNPFTISIGEDSLGTADKGVTFSGDLKIPFEKSAEFRGKILRREVSTGGGVNCQTDFFDGKFYCVELMEAFAAVEVEPDLELVAEPTEPLSFDGLEFEIPVPIPTGLNFGRYLKMGMAWNITIALEPILTPDSDFQATVGGQGRLPLGFTMENMVFKEIPRDDGPDRYKTSGDFSFDLAPEARFGGAFVFSITPKVELTVTMEPPRNVGKIEAGGPNFHGKIVVEGGYFPENAGESSCIWGEIYGVAAAIGMLRAEVTIKTSELPLISEDISEVWEMEDYFADMYRFHWIDYPNGEPICPFHDLPEAAQGEECGAGVATCEDGAACWKEEFTPTEHTFDNGHSETPRCTGLRFSLYWQDPSDLDLSVGVPLFDSQGNSLGHEWIDVFSNRDVGGGQLVGNTCGPDGPACTLDVYYGTDMYEEHIAWNRVINDPSEQVPEGNYLVRVKNRGSETAQCGINCGFDLEIHDGTNSVRESFEVSHLDDATTTWPAHDSSAEVAIPLDPDDPIKTD